MNLSKQKFSRFVHHPPSHYLVVEVAFGARLHCLIELLVNENQTILTVLFSENIVRNGA